jgi:hypothetical protein
MSVATITTTDLSSLELVEAWSKREPSERARGDRTARVVFFFDSPRDVVVFDEPFMPMDATVLGEEG